MLRTIHFPSFRLESGLVVRRVRVRYGTWGRLNPTRDNVIVVCHALTGDADAPRWWKGLIGPGCPLDTDRFFVVCANIIASPYGTLSPLTTNPDTGEPYGGDFPDVTLRDTVALHRLLLGRLGVRRVALVIGGSMGGMMALEWGFYGPFVQALCPIATSGRHSAWSIAWTEAQRQVIFADPRWRGGHYPPEDPPADGLATARMLAMLSYRSAEDYNHRFGRSRDPEECASFSVQRYLWHQGQKLVDRFDANCYVHLTRQMNTHDVARGRGPYPEVLRQIEQPALVVGISSDLLYPLAEQRELVAHLPRGRLTVLNSPYGHDAFLIETEQLARPLKAFIETHVPITPTVTA